MEREDWLKELERLLDEEDFLLPKKPHKPIHDIKINLKSNELCDFFECAALYLSKSGFIGNDLVDVAEIFEGKSEIEFHVAKDESMERAYQQIKDRLLEKPYRSALIMLAAKRGLATLGAWDWDAIENTVQRFADDCLDEKSLIIDGAYETEQCENYAIYLLCAKDVT